MTPRTPDPSTVTSRRSFLTVFAPMLAVLGLPRVVVAQSAPSAPSPDAAETFVPKIPRIVEPPAYNISPFFVFSARTHIVMGAHFLTAIEERTREVFPDESCKPFTSTDLHDFLTLREFYEDTLMRRRVFINRGLERDAGSEEKPRIIPGDLLRGVDEPKEKWTPALAGVDAGLRHFKQRYWVLPKETLAGVQTMIGCAVTSYGGCPLERIAADFDMSQFNEQVADAVRGSFRVG